MKILFVIPELGFADHISVAYLSAVAKKLGHETCFFNARVKECDAFESFGILDLTLKHKQPDIIAYSTTIQDFKKIVVWNIYVRKWWDFISILGGAHATFAPETIEESGMDYYCIGEGEGAFKDFLENCNIGRTSVLEKNIICTDTHTPLRSGLRPLIQDLDSLPFPDRDLILANSYLKDTPKKTFYTSRGCPYSCTYCSNNHFNKLYKGQKIVRRFSVDRVIEEIKYVRSRYRCNFIKFGDDLFALKADDWLYKFSVKYREEVGLPFNCYLRIDSINEELLSLLKNANCHSVHLSIDSTNENIREDILKRKSKLNNSQMIYKLRLINSYGIKTWVNYMLAVPTSSLKDDLSTIGLSKDGKVSYTHYSMTDPIKGTDLYDYCLEKNLIDKDYSGDMSNCSTRSVLKCFDNKDKAIRYNIYLLGALGGKLPYCLINLFIWILKFFKPNKFFEWIYKKYYKYNIEKVIYKLS